MEAKVSLTAPPRFEEKDLQYYLGALRYGRPLDQESAQLGTRQDPPNRGAVLISHLYIGAPDDLGRELLRTAIFNLNGLKSPPKYLIFIHEAVRLCLEDSEFVPVLQLLQKRGCSLRVCETSLHNLGLTDKLKVGHLVSVHLILDICLNSEKVIQL